MAQETQGMTPSYAWECVKAGWNSEKGWKPTQNSGKGFLDRLKDAFDNGWNGVQGAVGAIEESVKGALGSARQGNGAGVVANAIALGSKPYSTREALVNAPFVDVAAVQFGRGLRRGVNQATHNRLAAMGAMGWVAAAFFSSKLHPIGIVLPFAAGLWGAVLADPNTRAFMQTGKNGKNDSAIDNVGRAAEAVDRVVGTTSDVLNADKRLPVGMAAFFLGAYLLNRLAPKTSLSLGTLPISMVTGAVIGHWLGTETK